VPCLPKTYWHPPHVALLNEMAALREKIEGSSETIVNAMKVELNLRGIGGETFQANVILDNVQKVHDKMEAIMNTRGAAVVRR
jgi:hypothetical protein